MLRDHCAYCFETLLTHFDQSHPIHDPGFKNDKFPLFVTWKINSSNDYILRGCIGTFSPINLHDGLQEYALRSALNDSRFTPITRLEIPNLQVEISLLTEFEVCDLYDWEIGVHGIWIDYSFKNFRFSSTFLPQVAQEQNWTREETLISLVKKAGSNIDAININHLKVTRYKSLKGSMTFKEYLEWCQDGTRNVSVN